MPGPLDRDETNAEAQGRKAGAFLGGMLEALLKKWRELGLIVLVGGLGLQEMRVRSIAAEVPSFSEKEMKSIVREAIKDEIGSMRIGFEALIDTLPSNQAAKIRRDMARYELRRREADN